MSPETDNPTTEPSVAAAAAPAAAAAAEAKIPEENAAAEPAHIVESSAPEPEAPVNAGGPPVVASIDSPETAETRAAKSALESEGGLSVEVPTAAEEAEAEAAAASAEPAAEGETSPASEVMNEALIEQYSAPQKVAPEGEMIVGHVVAVNDKGVVVDFGAKSEGLVPAQEFTDAEQEIRFGPGQTIDVERTDQHKDGYIILSHQRARRRRAWENIEKSYRGKTNIDARVVDRIKGGLVVDIGVRAFLPASQVDLRPVHDLESWKGKEFPVRVLKMNRKRGNVVASRRAILEEEQQGQRQKLMDSLADGMTLTGKVKNITDYGVFVDLGGIDGLLHITDLSWGRLKHPSEAVQPGEEIEVQVLKFDREKNRVSLGRKQLLPDPWAGVPERFPVGGRVHGKIVGITDYGAFIELAQGVEGLVHISEMTWSKRLKHPSKLVNVGDMVEAVVLGVNTEQRRISLGMKQTTPDPWETLSAKYPVGTVVTGKVRNLTEFGAFVEIEEGFDGLVHVSDLSWTTKVKNPSEMLKKGETVEARVLKVDAPNRRVSLGIKQVNDIWANWFKEHKVNGVVRGKVTRITTFGAFVELAAGIEGLCHISEIEDRKRDKDKGRGDMPSGRSGKPGPSGKPAIPLVSGNEYDFKIVKLNVEEHKIGLSYRAAQKQVEKREMEEYKSSKSSSTATLGDVFYAKRGSGQ